MEDQSSLKVSLHGMDVRMQAMMKLYLELNCKGIADVVDDFDSNAEIVDVDDVAVSKNILQERVAQHPERPIIAISLYDVSSDLAIYVKKPIEVYHLVGAIKKAKKVLLGRSNAKNNIKSESMPVIQLEINQKQKIKKKDKAKDNTVINRVDNVIETSVSEAKIPSKTKNNIDTSSVEKTLSPEFRSEIEMFLNEFNVPKYKGYLKEGANSNSFEKNRRKTVRYEFQGVKGYLKKNSVLGFKQNLSVEIQVISSKGALIKLEKKLKLNEKIVLEIQLGSRHVFIIPAKVVRQKSDMAYGLVFEDFQYKVPEYLIASGVPFNI